GKPDRLQARRRRRRAHLFCAACRRETETALSRLLAPKYHSDIPMGEFAIGQGVPRFEDPRLLRGGGQYVGDVWMPGMAHGVVLRAQDAHAKVRSIDAAAARAAPGVLCVLTAKEWKASGFGELPGHSGLKLRDGSPMFKPSYPVLAEDRVRWVGDCVAFI